MKAISLTQPFATLVAIGAKRLETRSWYTSYRGPLAIHAAKGYPKTALKLASVEPLRNALTHAGLDPLSLPRGMIVATCRLVAVFHISDRELSHQLPAQQADAPLMVSLAEEWPVPEWVTIPPTQPELSFGDYAPGRYAWVLYNVTPLPQPIPARGAFGLWDWIPPAP